MAEPTLVYRLLRRGRALAGPARRGPSSPATAPSGRSPSPRSATQSAAYAQALRERGVGAGRPGRGDARQPAGVPAGLARADAARRGDGAAQRALPLGRRRPRASTTPGARLAVTVAGVRRPARRPARRPSCWSTTSCPTGDVGAGAGRPGRDRQRAVHLRHDRAPQGLPALAPLLDHAGAPRARGVPARRRRRRDADRPAVPLPRPAVERRDRADGRRPPGRARRLPPVDVLGQGARARGDLLLLPRRDADAAAARCRPTRSTATTGCAPCSARRSRRRCTPSSRSAGACRGSRRSG